MGLFSIESERDCLLIFKQIGDHKLPSNAIFQMCIHLPEYPSNAFPATEGLCTLQ